jgi:copper chaperone CopZ
MRGGGFVQVVLVLVVIGIVTLVALRLFERSPLPQVGPGARHPARAVLDRVELQVEGMNSEADAAQVEEAARRQPGVASIRVELGSGRAEVTFNPAQTNPEQIIAAIARGGFRARR